MNSGKKLCNFLFRSNGENFSNKKNTNGKNTILVYILLANSFISKCTIFMSKWLFRNFKLFCNCNNILSRISSLKKELNSSSSHKNYKQKNYKKTQMLISGFTVRISGVFILKKLVPEVLMMLLISSAWKYICNYLKS